MWTDECTHAFMLLEHYLCSSLILVYPDFEKSFIVQTYLYMDGLGVILAKAMRGGGSA